MSLSRLLAFVILPLALASGGALAANPEVELDTTAGKIRIELFPDAAPKTVANFLDYVKSGYYEGTQFHRVINGFMIQGGGFTTDFNQKPTKAPVPIEAEQSKKAGLSNVPGTVAMARTRDPNSATAQFFINVADNAFLNHTAPTAQGWGYAVFGKVVGGTDIVDRLKKVKTGNRGYHGDVPLDDVVIEKAVVV
jgi:cyclophilin family peptidyl-prolyl cis-trans isomerase